MIVDRISQSIIINDIFKVFNTHLLDSMNDLDTKIISLHTPKSAGTSLRHAFNTAYGEDHVLEDYEEIPDNVISRASIDPDYYVRNPIFSLGKYKVVHGHFLPQKYGFIDNALRITFLRNPIENLISIYFYWKTLKNTNNPVHDYVTENNLSLLEFASLPKMRWLYTKVYFSDYDMNKFSFIGDFSNLKSEMTRLSDLIDVNIDSGIHENKTNLEDKQESVRRKSECDKNTVRVLEQLLREDISFYEMHKGK